jgi:predicted porin
MKKSILASSILALLVASAANAGQTFDTAAGSLYLGGDVEFDYTSETDKNLASGGRIEVVIQGERVLDSGAFAMFKVAPRIKAGDGDHETGDLKLGFGMKDDWSITTGRFEAADLSTAGQDTYIAESGTTMYRAATARGRTGESGDAQVTFNKAMGAAAFELTAQSQESGDLVILRPVVTADLGHKVSMTFGLEVPVVGNDDNARDEADWLGAGGSITLQATDDLALTARAAYLADDRAQTNSVDSYTAGLNAQFQNFFISALYGESDADANTTEIKDTTELQVYASYKIPAVMEIDNFDIYLGAGWSEAKISDVTQDEVVGARIRLKYIF